MKRATFHQFRNIKFSASTLRALRWLIGVLVLSMMVWQIAMKSDVTVWWSQLQVAWTSEGKFIWFLLAVALMPLNWFLEIAKWRQLLLQRWNINWSIATKAVLAGVSVSLTTPNRIGEYAGRMLVAPSEQAVTVVKTGSAAYSSLSKPNSPVQ